jgi:hypothetical protein
MYLRSVVTDVDFHLFRQVKATVSSQFYANLFNHILSSYRREPDALHRVAMQSLYVLDGNI